MTYSVPYGLVFTRINGYPSAGGQVQARENGGDLDTMCYIIHIQQTNMDYRECRKCRRLYMYIDQLKLG